MKALIAPLLIGVAGCAGWSLRPNVGVITRTDGHATGLTAGVQFVEDPDPVEVRVVSRMPEPVDWDNAFKGAKRPADPECAYKLCTAFNCTGDHEFDEAVTAAPVEPEPEPEEPDQSILLYAIAGVCTLIAAIIKREKVGAVLSKMVGR